MDDNQGCHGKVLIGYEDPRLEDVGEDNSEKRQVVSSNLKFVLQMSGLGKMTGCRRAGLGGPAISWDRKMPN